MPHKFGWCLDGNDDKCRVHYRNWDDTIIECACSCHEGKPKPDLGDSKVSAPPDVVKPSRKRKRNA